MSVSHSDKAEVRTVAFWLQETGEAGAVSVTLGMGFGMALGLRHPEYAQAYVRLMGVPPASATIDDFVEAVPIQVKGELEDAVPPSQ